MRDYCFVIVGKPNYMRDSLFEAIVFKSRWCKHKGFLKQPRQWVGCTPYFDVEIPGCIRFKNLNKEMGKLHRRWAKLTGRGVIQGKILLYSCDLEISLPMYKPALERNIDMFGLFVRLLSFEELCDTVQNEVLTFLLQSPFPC